MRGVYARIGSHIKVEPLKLHQTELDVKAFLSLMAIEAGDTTPLYMQTVKVSPP